MTEYSYVVDTPDTDRVSLKLDSVIQWTRKIRALLDSTPEWGRTVLSAEEVYRLAQEAVETVYFLVKEEHRRSPTQNFDIRFSLSEVDSLSNPKSWKTRPRNVLVAPDPMELEALLFIEQNLISLRKSRRPIGPTTPSSPKITPRKSKKGRKRRKSRQNRKRWYYPRVHKT